MQREVPRNEAEGLFTFVTGEKTPLQKYNIIHCRGAFHMLPYCVSGGYGIRPYDFANNYLLDKPKFATGRRDVDPYGVGANKVR